ncbi:MAG: AI-2E family transporter, partial [Desulfobacterales bacterium]|nr:AI-2E family transporter [Desulfobacterales bacterium]
IAVISAPPLFWLRQKGLPTAVALLVVILGVAGMGGIFVALVGTSLDSFTQALPFYQARLKELVTQLFALTGRLGLELPDQKLLEYFNPGAAMRLVGTTLSRLGGVLTNGFLILLTVIFILLEASSLPAKVHAALEGRDASLERLETMMANVKRYMAIKTLASLLTGAVIAAWLAVVGVDYPVLWGLLAFLLNFVPNIGSIIAAVPAVLLALIQLGLAPTLYTAAGYLVVNLLVGSVLEPRFMGRGLGLSTLVVFLSLVFWGWVLGPVGMLLSVPLTMAVKIGLESNDDTRWLATLLGATAPQSPAQPSENHSLGLPAAEDPHHEQGLRQGR